VPAQLDRSRYFATVHGEFDDEVRYWQDGLPFDAHGRIVIIASPDDVRTEQALGEPAPAPKAALAPARPVMRAARGVRPHRAQAKATLGQNGEAAGPIPDRRGKRR